MGYGDTASAKEAAAERSLEEHNKRIDEMRVHTCPQCYEEKGIKRPLGVGTFGVDKDIATCPVCHYKKPASPGTVIEDPPDYDDVPF